MIYIRHNEQHLLPEQNLPFDTTGFDESWQKSQAMLRKLFDSVIAIDLDGTIYDVKSDTLRPGVIDVFRDMRDAGNNLYVWSARTAHIAEPIVRRFGLMEFVDGIYDKPPLFDRSVEAVEETLGFVPDITVDNEVSECIQGPVDFVLVPTYYPHDIGQVTTRFIQATPVPVSPLG